MRRSSVVTGNPFAIDETVASVYVYLHFKQFLKLYNAPAHDRAALDAACGHVQVGSTQLQTMCAANILLDEAIMHYYFCIQ